MTVHVALLIAALVCFIVAVISGFAGSTGGWARVNFLALGLAFWAVNALVAVLPAR